MKKITGPLKKSMSERFRILRAKLNLTQKDFSKNLGIIKDKIINIETERQLPTISIIITLMNTYRVSPFWLLKGEGDIFIKDKEPELSQLELFKKTFPNVPAEPDLIKMIESMAVPVLKNAIILKSLELKEVYRPHIEAYEKEKAQVLSSKRLGE
jgi:transcriptional regulator with XRE-family HTH domain